LQQLAAYVIDGARLSGWEHLTQCDRLGGITVSELSARNKYVKLVSARFGDEAAARLWLSSVRAVATMLLSPTLKTQERLEELGWAEAWRQFTDFDSAHPRRALASRIAAGSTASLEEVDELSDDVSFLSNELLNVTELWTQADGLEDGVAYRVTIAKQFVDLRPDRLPADLMSRIASDPGARLYESMLARVERKTGGAGRPSMLETELRERMLELGLEFHRYGFDCIDDQRRFNASFCRFLVRTRYAECQSAEARQRFVESLSSERRAEMRAVSGNTMLGAGLWRRGDESPRGTAIATVSCEKLEADSALIQGRAPSGPGWESIRPSGALQRENLVRSTCFGTGEPQLLSLPTLSNTVCGRLHDSILIMPGTLARMYEAARPGDVWKCEAGGREFVLFLSSKCDDELPWNPDQYWARESQRAFQELAAE
jgi:hypothetical protein